MKVREADFCCCTQIAEGVVRFGCQKSSDQIFCKLWVHISTHR